MVDKPTPQEIEYEKKQFLLALLDRRLQLLSTLCQPHTFSAFRSEADELVKEVLDTANLSDYLSGRTETGAVQVLNTVVIPEQSLQHVSRKVHESLPVLFGVSLVLTQDEANKVLEVFGNNLSLQMYEVHSSTVHENTTELLVRLDTGVYDTTGKAHIEALLRKMIGRSEVLFGKGVWPRMDAYISSNKLTEYTSVKASVRQQ